MIGTKPGAAKAAGAPGAPLRKRPAARTLFPMTRFLALALLLAAAGPALLHPAQRAPDWMIPLRDAIYEQVLPADDVRHAYLAAQSAARGLPAGAGRDIELSRAEFFMGRALLFEERGAEARAHFAEGLRLAEAAVAAAPGSADAWVLRAENLSHKIQADGRRTFAMRHGLDVTRFAERALEIDPRSAAAQYLVAARYVFAPGILGNINRGVGMMKAIYNGGGDMGRDDLFNVASAIGWGRVQQGNFGEAVPWLQRALEVYPTNRFAADLLEEAQSGGGRRRSR